MREREGGRKEGERERDSIELQLVVGTRRPFTVINSFPETE